MKFVAVAIVSLVVGIGAGLLIQPQESTEPTFMAGSEELVCGDTLQSIRELPEAENRNSEANKILADILKLFLADVALRISNANQGQIEGLVPQQKCTPQVVYRERGGDESKNSKNETEKKIEEELSRVVDRERRGGDLRNAREEKEFIDGTVVENIFSHIKNTKPALRSMVRPLEGLFLGEVHLNDEKGTVWQAEFKVENMKVDGDKLTADRSFVLSKDGKKFSNSSGNGDMDYEHKRLSENSRAIIIESGGGSLYFQLYLVDRNQKLIGTVYKKKSVDKYLPHGTVRLIRQ